MGIDVDVDGLRCFQADSDEPLRTLWQMFVAQHKGPLWLFQRFEIQTTIICGDNDWVYAEQQFLSKGQIVAISVIKGGVLQEGRLLEVSHWMPEASLVSVLGKPELVDVYQRLKRPCGELRGCLGTGWHRLAVMVRRCQLNMSKRDVPI